jgi:Na+/proline symporter
MAVFTQISNEERNSTLLLVTLVIVLIGGIYNIITTDDLRGIIISLVLILICAVMVSVGLK